MSEETVPEAASPPPPQGQPYFDRFSEDDPEYMRLRNRAADLRQDFNLMEQKKRVTMILQSPSFREELEGLIQEQMKKGNNSSNIWALRQIADFMASTSHAVFPTSSMNVSMMTPINDLHTADSLNLAKGERLMRCKISSVYRLLDLYGWAQLSDTYVTLRVSKEQDHFLISPKGVSCSEVTASSLIKEVLEMRNKIREQNRQDVKSAGPQSQLLASVIAEKSRSPSTESQLMSKGDEDTKDDSEETVPNPFSQLTDQELEEYKKEVERKKLELDETGQER
ncbi:ADD2 isoform 7, partial [Pan troglodytes]|uniref:Isoform 5 of Beta-adducin n=4 Tax=Hominidae TaxID=9604 RepID=P35612-5